MKQKRDTFISYQDMLRDAAERCRLAERYLRSCRDEARDQWRDMIEQVAVAESDLADGLERFASEGPREILDTRIQYTAEPREEQAPPATVGAALKQLLATNDDIRARLEQQAEKMNPEELQEEASHLTEKMDAVGRRISMIRLSAEDI